MNQIKIPFLNFACQQGLSVIDQEKFEDIN
jgi:hypothetical protein